MFIYEYYLADNLPSCSDGLREVTEKLFAENSEVVVERGCSLA
jgi:hypothetical protein